jgi:magnesium transporter
VQSSAIIVQGLANNTLSGSLFNRLVKEVSLSLLNGVILAILFVGSHYLLDVKMVIGNCYHRISFGNNNVAYRNVCTLIG